MALSKLKFKQVNILKDAILGVGSYGTVYRAKCDDLLCAAKCLHPAILYQANAQAEYSRSPVSRFEREIHLLSSFHHPNIVQYLGVHEDSNMKQPVLLMELLDQSLTKYLESAPQLIPYHLQVNICHDIVLALSFLHHNNIFHRDLSSNNILMLGDRAKITDFGMANTTKAISSQMTKCPGTNVYMPPEAVTDDPKYNAKIDCFSFGVLGIQIMTKQYPNPGEKEMPADNSEENFLSIFIRVSEVERRKSHIDLIHPNHALLPISLDCLNVDMKLRPSAQKLCERIATLKESPEYAKSKEILSSKVKTQQSSDDLSDVSEISSKDLESFIFQAQELQNLCSLLEAEREKYSKEISEAKLQIYQLEATNANQVHEIKQLEATNAEQMHEIEHLKMCLGGAVSVNESLIQNQQMSKFNASSIESDQSQTTKSLHSLQLGKTTDLNWKEGSDAPPDCRISKGYSVVNGNMVYVSSTTKKIITYNCSTESWSVLPECPTSEFAMVDIDGNLTIIGGYLKDTSVYSNCLYTYNEDSADEQYYWTDDYPRMPTKRKAAAALCIQSVLIVVGGEVEGGYITAKVEVMDINTSIWSSAVSLPSARKNASISACGHCLYLVGGNARVSTMKKRLVHMYVLSVFS